MWNLSSFRVPVLGVVSIVTIGLITYFEAFNKQTVADTRAHHEKIHSIAGHLGHHYPKQRFHQAFSHISDDEYALNDGRKDHCRKRRKKKCVECNEGYFGKECRRVCSLFCKDGCRKEDGSCRACAAGNFGPKCNKKCPVFCGRWNSQIDCLQSSGHCSNGCRYGYWGFRCRNTCDRCLDNACIFDDGTCLQGCSEGYFGTRSKTPCPRHCKNNTCSVSGLCSVGCKEGYFGKKCNMPCSSNCKRYVCSDEGHCTEGCRNGLFGKHCNQSCEVGFKENNCEQIVMFLLLLIVIVSVVGLIWIPIR